MHHHAVTMAMSLYQNGTLTLDQAAGYAGVTPGAMRERLRTQGVELRDEATLASGVPVTP